MFADVSLGYFSYGIFQDSVILTFQTKASVAGTSA